MPAYSPRKPCSERVMSLLPALRFTGVASASCSCRLGSGGGCGNPVASPNSAAASFRSVVALVPQLLHPAFRPAISLGQKDLGESDGLLHAHAFMPDHAHRLL